MKTLIEHIKSKQFSKLYLIYGTDRYLIQLYKNKMKSAIVGEDTMNYSYIEGSSITVPELISLSDTLPFFSEHRLIIYENSGFFKHATDFSDYADKLPDTTVLIFIESEVDKRSRMYKAVKELGTISEINGLDEKNLKLFALKKLKDADKKISENTLLFLLEYIGTDLQNLDSELEKLICYAYEREAVTVEDIKSVCTEQLTGKVFQITEAIVLKDKNKAFGLYKSLLDLKEKPLGILFQIIRHYNCLLQIKELSADNATIASKVGIMPFLVTKYLNQARKYTYSQLQSAVSYGTQLEQDIKSGLMDEKLGLELLIVRLTSM